MSWAEVSDERDTLSELRPLPSRLPGSSSRGRPSKVSASALGGGSKSERRLLIEAKATISAAIAEERKERLLAKRRARRCVSFLYYAFKVVGVAACVYTSGLNLTLVYMRLDLRLQDRLARCYLVLFGVGGVLAELDTPFAKANFRALQKWWFKAPFYVFMGWLCLDARHARGTVWFPLELASFVALQGMAAMSIVLNVCLREVLERSGALGKRKKSRRRRGAKTTKATSRGREGGGARGRGSGGASSASGGLGVSSFRERDRRRHRPPSSPGVASSTGSVQTGGGAGFGDRHSPPEMVPEKSGRLVSPTNAYGGGGGGKHESYGSVENGGDGAAGVGRGHDRGGTIAGKIKWWLEGDEDESPSVHGESESAESPVSPMSASTARSSGRTNWWEDSDGDDGMSSLASFALRDDASEVGSVASGFSSVSTSGGGGRFGSGAMLHGRGTAPLRKAASVSSRRSAVGSARGGLEQRPPPLVTAHHRGFGSGGGPPGGSAAGGGHHVTLTAQALARNSSEAPHPMGRGLGYAGTGGGNNYADSLHDRSVTGSATGGFGGGGSLRSFGTGRARRRPEAWESGGQRRAASTSGDTFRAAAGRTSWTPGGSDYDGGLAGSEAGGGDDRGEDGPFTRGGNANSRRTPGIVDLTPF